MANITKPAVERHSCDIAGCASMAENPMYWGVSFPVIAQDNYDDGSYFGGTRTRIINRTLDLCEHHAGTLLALHGQHTSNYGEAWTDDGPELQAHDARREQAEGRRAMTKVDKAVKQLNDSGIPAMRSSDSDYLVFEIGESVFRALLSAGLDLLVMSDGTWRPDGFDSDVKGTAGDVRDYLSQWVEEQS